jgi:SAM-dependent methyltransferase
MNVRYEPRVLVRRVTPRQPGALTLAGHALASLVLVPSCLLAAAAIGAPGLRFHWDAAHLAAHLVMRGGRRRLMEAGRLALYPMDSTRYFEFDWVWSRLKRLGPVGRYLDVSSPRLLPLCYARSRSVREAWLLNPDARDLSTTQQWAAAWGVSDKCRFAASTVESTGLGDYRFDVITSISVVEHIADDRQTLADLRGLLAPGGTMLVTVPCAARGYDQYRDYDEYQLARADADGRFFFQRFYDASSLRDRVFSVLGQPSEMVVYGEREPGYFGRNAEQKMRGLPYPFWREGFMMGRHFQRFPSIDALPGEGVVAMEFTSATEPPPPTPPPARQ